MASNYHLRNKKLHFLFNFRQKNCNICQSDQIKSQKETHWKRKVKHTALWDTVHCALL